MKKPEVDYRKLRLSNLNSPEYSHLLLLLGWVGYFALYFLTENLIPPEQCYPMHCRLDDLIPFHEAFIIPYVFWYGLIVISLGWFLLYDVQSFKCLQTYIIITQAVAMTIYILLPSRQDLRPEVFPRENVLTDIIAYLYAFDTSTGVCPSLHVAYSLGIASTWVKKKDVPWWLRGLIVAVVAVICVSVAFVKQHSVLDILAAIPVGLLAEWVVLEMNGGEGEEIFVKKTLAWILTVCILMSMFPTTGRALEVLGSGKCGNNVYWQLTDDGRLWVHGVGEMWDDPEIDIGVDREAATYAEFTGDVTSIGAYFFTGFPNVEKVTISCPLLKIGGYAFAFSKITELALPSGVTSIGNSAFESCSDLETINLPRSITSIGARAFCDCVSLKDVVLPSGLTAVGEWAFNGCRELTSIQIPEKVTRIYPTTFGECKKLTEVTIPYGVTRIDGDAFKGCSSLTTVSIPGSVRTVGSGAFRNCGSLSSAVFRGHAPSSFGSGVFDGAAADFTIYYPEEGNGWSCPTWYGYRTAISDNPEGIVARGTCGEDLSWELKNTGSLRISGSGEMDDYLNTPSPWRGYTVTDVIVEPGTANISSKAFYEMQTLRTVVIPETVTRIGQEAFAGCAALGAVKISQGVVQLERRAFRDCVGLTEVVLPNGLTMIGEEAFAECSGLTQVEFGKDVQTLGTKAFYRCRELAKVTFHGDAPENVGTSVFGGVSLEPELYYTYGTQGWPVIWHPAGRQRVLPNDAGIIQTGRYGADVTWTMDSEGTLVISGTGPMWDRNGWDSMFQELEPVTVVIGAGIETIGKNAFYNCTKLEHVSIPDSVKEIGDRAFFGCGSLDKVSIPDSVEHIGGYAFYSCTDLTEITMPRQNTELGASMFGKCESLKQIRIPDGTESIGEYMFFRCTGLVSVEIPDTVVRIEEKAFYNCRSLSGMDLPRKLVYIGPEAFYDCGSLTELVIPEGVTEIADRAFCKCSSLVGVTLPRGLIRIGEEAFCDCGSLPGIVIPAGVTAIGSEAFESCRKLSWADFLGDAPNEFGSSVFSSVGYGFRIYFREGTAGWTTPTWNGYFTALYLGGERILASGSCGENVTWELKDTGTLTIRGSGAMMNCANDFDLPCKWQRDLIQAVVIEEGVTCIGSYAFCGCANMSSVVIPNSVTDIGAHAFNDCTGLTEVRIPDRVTGIGEYAFYDCTGLTGVKIPDGVTVIGDSAFGSSGLINVTVPASVTELGSNVFYRCTDLKEARIEAGISKIGSCTFYECTALERVSLPAGVEYIDGEAFYGCASLAEVELPESLDRIGYNAFFGCGSLRQIRIPASVTQIDKGAFQNCGGITAVYFLGNAPSMGASYIFGEPSGNIKLYYENGTSGWSTPIWNQYRAEPRQGGSAVVDSGTCGKNITWTLDEAGTLAFSGTGEMEDYAYDCNMPWDAVLGPWEAEKVRTVVIGFGITRIGNWAFCTADGLKAVWIPKTVTEIGDGAFAWCRFKSILIPDQVTVIGERAFYGGRLNYAGIPASVTQIGTEAFGGCDYLERIQASDENSCYSSDQNGVLYNKDKTVLIQCPGGSTEILIMPDSVSEIGDYAFRGVNRLSEVRFSDNLTRIGQRAFMECGFLTGELKLPEKVASIGDEAFYYCRGLTRVVIPERTAYIGKNAFVSLWSNLRQHRTIGKNGAMCLI